MTRCERFDVRALAPQRWKNGAGLTREIAFGGADPANFDWRVSVAEVERDAPFSAFPGIDRAIVLLRGAGMRLRSDDGRIDHALTEPLVPFRFPGDVPLSATLAGGASSDFNVMTRRGVFRSALSCHRAAADLDAGALGLLLCCTGAWAIGRDAPIRLEPLQGLLWRTAPGPIAVAPLDPRGALLLVRLCHDRPT